ncbi:unnamed protein product, partial [Brachionus calyciflorus]
MIETLKDLYLHQNVNFPTFVKLAISTGNVLDYVITESEDRILKICSGPPLGNVNQGHTFLEWDYRTKPKIKHKIFSSEKFNFYKANYSKIDEEIAKINWNKIFHSKNVNEMYSLFLNEHSKVCDELVPKKKDISNRRVRPKWTNKNLEELSKKKNKLWFQCKNSKFKNKKLVSEYKSTRIECSKLINFAVRCYEYNLGIQAKKNPKLIYS